MTGVLDTTGATGARGGFDLGAYLAGLARRAATAMAAGRAKARAREDYARLRGFDDAMLRDIGMTRAGIDDAERGL